MLNENFFTDQYATKNLNSKLSIDFDLNSVYSWHVKWDILYVQYKENAEWIEVDSLCFCNYFTDDLYNQLNSMH